MRRLYHYKRLRADKVQLVKICDKITQEYKAQNLKLTLRQLYYQLVSKAIIPNEEKWYKLISTILSDGRLAGAIDWEAIEDRVRRPKSPPEFESLAQLIEAAVSSYRLPRMEGQDTYVELWVEKDALAGVLEPIAYKYHIVLMVNRGYSSQSAMHDAAIRIDAACRNDDGDVCKDATILYLGDLDPSGEDMVYDIEDRIMRFLKGGYDIDEAMELRSKGEDANNVARLSPCGIKINKGDIIVPLTIEKLALTMDQVRKYDPPPNPAKRSDTRAQKFIDKFGESSWEVDALPPAVLRSIITARLNQMIDHDKVDEIKEREKHDIARLRSLVEDQEL